MQRSYDARGKVLDYRKLRHCEIMSLIEASKLPVAAEAEVKRAFAGVDGHDVTAEEQLMHPPNICDLMIVSLTRAQGIGVGGNHRTVL